MKLDEEDGGTKKLITGIAISGLLTLVYLRGFFADMGSISQQIAANLKGEPAQMQNVNPRAQMGQALSRAEITRKLDQVPVFYVVTSDGRVNIDQSGDRRMGRFFLEPSEATQALEDLKMSDYIQWKDAFIGAARLGDVYFPLVKKEGKLKSFPYYVDTSAAFAVVPSNKELANAQKRIPNWSEGPGKAGEVPIWGTQSLAFEGDGDSPTSRLRIPLFIRLEDLEESWRRLKAESPTLPDKPDVRASTLGSSVEMLEEGGTPLSPKVFEFFPSPDAIQKASDGPSAA
ncbi:unnamed protein product [Vitrella brassicaformis CCMP3155]|uniref:Uncharacterized protein n=2 Tax=Vitrella brassicaformis TaxID=1169539 RepID=A0A0G4F5C5_VITBC|nr:unnamed protein product [Vitrella brassicaformis CCMP3155]|eukprot:CEM06928.1 unnamed protein product [Vitrella brassicaformis CCMP3155]